LYGHVPSCSTWNYRSGLGGFAAGHLVLPLFHVEQQRYGNGDRWLIGYPPGQNSTLFRVELAELNLFTTRAVSPLRLFYVILDSSTLVALHRWSSCADLFHVERHPDSLLGVFALRRAGMEQP